eukprot:1158688-Rhodomonas_salina.2
MVICDEAAAVRATDDARETVNVLVADGYGVFWLTLLSSIEASTTLSGAASPAAVPARASVVCTSPATLPCMTSPPPRYAQNCTRRAVCADTGFVTLNEKM